MQQFPGIYWFLLLFKAATRATPRLPVQGSNENGEPVAFNRVEQTGSPMERPSGNRPVARRRCVRTGRAAIRK
jgi:hypothetical protein